MASNSSDESSLVESSGEGMIGDAGCRHVHSMSDVCGCRGSDMLRARMHEVGRNEVGRNEVGRNEVGRNRGPGSVDSITLSNVAIASLCTFLRSLGLST
jgi:hypothetical protein